ncbi:PGF-CTERM sorting domain-containing protein [Halovivax gelatinilyticus]|uniref:PGF-CTERM sorting domain-containing protein n=1 Tax=Halovivax gelatinilyticus TaxID=2961597 RepID=UPI0020CA39D4|nr:PGF-CTERM sorting domain-containing protein [Halovivax gelatinilyticus]
MSVKTPIQTVAVVVIVALVATSVAGVAPVAADDDDPPPPPHAFYGEVYLDGEPAPAGTEIVAKIDGEERGSIVVEEDGAYGGPTVGDAKLTVSGESGAEITFHVDGVEAEQTATWESGTNTELHLVAGDEPAGGLPPAPDDDDDAGDADGTDEPDDGADDDTGESDSNGGGTDGDDAGDDSTDQHDDGGDDAADDSAMTGFGVVVALVGLLSIATFVARRR